MPANKKRKKEEAPAKKAKAETPKEPKSAKKAKKPAKKANVVKAADPKVFAEVLLDICKALLLSSRFVPLARSQSH